MEKLETQMKNPFINDSHELNFDRRKKFACIHMRVTLFLVIHT